MRTEPERREEQIVEETYIVDNRSTPEASNIEVNEEEPRREKVKQEIKISLLFTCIVSKEIRFHWYFVYFVSQTDTFIDRNLLETKTVSIRLSSRLVEMCFVYKSHVLYACQLKKLYILHLDELGQAPFGKNCLDFV